MTIVVPQLDPMTGHPVAGFIHPMATSSVSQPEPANARPLETANALVDSFLQQDSVFPQMLDTLKATQSKHRNKIMTRLE